LQSTGEEMLDAIILVIVVIGGSYAIYYGVQFLLKLIFHRKPKNWVTQNYKKHSGVDFSKADRVVTSGVLPTEEFTHWEMITVFGLYLLKTEVPDVLEKAEVFGNQGWKKNYGYDFYEEIATRALKISAQGYKKNARKLIMFGQRLAEMYDEKVWVEKYKKILDEQLSELSTLEWDFTR
jgi:hypothetical protein